jgi:hypothetical protein
MPTKLDLSFLSSRNSAVIGDLHLHKRKATETRTQNNTICAWTPPVLEKYL